MGATNTAVAKRRTYREVTKSKNTSFFTLRHVNLLVGTFRACAGATHYDRLATSEFGNRSIILRIGCEMQTNAIAAVCLDPFDQHFKLFDGHMRSKGVLPAKFLRIVNPTVLLIGAEEGGYVFVG